MNRFISLLTFIFLLCMGWTGAWFYIATRITNEANTLFASTTTLLQRFECENIDVAGFPFRFDVTCTNALMVDNDIELLLPEIMLTVLAYRPTHALVFAMGPAQISDSFSGSKREIHWDNLRASLRTNGWALARFSLEADNLQLIDSLFSQTLLARIEHFETHLVDQKELYSPATRFARLSGYARINQAQMSEFDISKTDINLEFELGAMPDDLRNWSIAAISRNWFENETGIEQIILQGHDPVSSFKLDGAVTTTAQSMLNGDFGLHTENISPRFATLLSPTITQIIFGMQNEDNTHDQSYSIRHGVVLAGNLPIFTFAPLR